MRHGSGVDKAPPSQAVGQLLLPSSGQVFSAFCLPYSPPLTWSHPSPPIAEPKTLERFHTLVTVCLGLYLVVKSLSSPPV